MMFSKYNYLFNSNDVGTFLYNAINNSFIELTKEQYNILLNIKEDIACIDDIDNIFLQQLVENKIIVENDFDGYYQIKFQRLHSRFDDTYLSLTIVPTMSCNFACTYCYEGSNHPNIEMDEKTEKKLVEFIKKFDNVNRIRVTWYGGEPLLKLHRIQSLTEQIKSINANLSAYMITNGYLMTKDVVDELDNLRIESIQITLDGLEETHNKRRPHVTEKDSFQKIIQNIEYSFSKYDNKEISLRVNIDTLNESEFTLLYKYLFNKFKSKKLYVHPGYITNIYSAGACNSMNCEFDREMKSKFMLEQFEKNGIQTLKFFPTISIGECCARHINSFVIGPKGEIYKCWNDIGINSKEIGNVHLTEMINPTLAINYLTGADPLEDINCQKCFYFAICGGGCTYSRLKNKFENTNIDTCTVIKGNLDKFLKIHHFIKKINDCI